MKVVKFASRFLVLFILILFGISLKSEVTNAASFNVVGGTDGLSADSNCTLSEAVQNIADAAQTYSECATPDGNDTINLPSGTINLTGALPISTHPYSVVGTGVNNSIIDGAETGSLFYEPLGTVTTSTPILFKDFTAKNIDRSTGVCISVSSSSSNSVAVQDATFTGLNLQNCGRIAIGAAIYNLSTSISNVSISSDLTQNTVGIFAMKQALTMISNTTVTGEDMGMYFVSSDYTTSTSSYQISNSTLTQNRLAMLFFISDWFGSINAIANMYNNTIVNNTNSGGGSMPTLINTGGIGFGTANEDTLTVNMNNNLVVNNKLGSSLSNCYAGSTQEAASVTVNSAKNLSDDTCASKFGGSDFINVSGAVSTIDALSDNGGPVKTMALLIGSPALDQGQTLGFLTTDARGIARPQGAAYDIGAYEKTVGSTPDPDPVPEDPGNPGPPGNPGSPSTPGAPRTGKLIGAFLASVSIIALLVLVSKEVVEGRVKVSKSEK